MFKLKHHNVNVNVNITNSYFNYNATEIIFTSLLLLMIEK